MFFGSFFIFIFTTELKSSKIKIFVNTIRGLKSSTFFKKKDLMLDASLSSK